MKLSYLKSLSAVALTGMFAMNAAAESISQEYVIDFTTMEVGHLLNSFWGGPNPGMAVVANPDGDGNLFFMSGSDGVNEDTGLPTWNTLARITPFSLPKGFTLSDVTMVTAEYMPTQEDGIYFGIQLQNPMSGYMVFEETPVVNEWNMAVFDLENLMTEPAEGEEAVPMVLPATCDFCFGAKGSTNYYVKNITFYLEKEVSEREKAEAALNKDTAPCVEFNFDNWDTSVINEDGTVVEPHIGTNNTVIMNRSDFLIDKGPEGYDNNCLHIIYGGHTQVFINDPMIQCPEGMTFDDLRLVEYDIYQTKDAGVDASTGTEFPGYGAPMLKFKALPGWGQWASNNDGSSCGNPTFSEENVGKWTHVEFYPSAYVWGSREFEQDVLDEDGNVKTDAEGNAQKEKIVWDAEKNNEEFNKLTTFVMSLGFFPCLNQCYVDNVKLWFQKIDVDAVESIEASKVADSAIYNVFGQRVDENYRGIVIKNGKKVLVK